MIEDNSLGLEFKYLIVNDMDRKFGLWMLLFGNPCGVVHR